MNDSKIEWTDHTFNPWWGCVKVSAGCKNCYAESLDRRWKGGHWGPGSTRKSMSDDYWKLPLKWDKAAAAAGVMAKVFCASMADWAEWRDTVTNTDVYSVILKSRVRLFTTIYETPHLIWQLLTKRIQHVWPILMETAIAMPHAAVRQWMYEWLDGKPPANVWIGTSVENQEAADERIPYLLEVPAAVRFLSCEPLLGAVDLRNIRQYNRNDDHIASYQCLNPITGCGDSDRPAIDWVIAGGESGHGARPMHPDWARSLRDQCASADVPFFFKQWGEWADDGGYQVRVGKKLAGRLLDGVEHNAFPV